MSAGIDCAQTVESGHNTLCIVAFQTALEAAQLVLTRSLLGYKGGGSRTVGFLMVQCKVLRFHHQALGLPAFADGHTQNIGKHRVFGIILVIA